jgi:hypothetical protein
MLISKLMQNLRNAWLFALITIFFSFLTSTSDAEQLPLNAKPIEDVTSMFDLGDFFPDGSRGVLIFRIPEKIIGLYKYTGERLALLDRAEPLAYFEHAYALPQRYGASIAIAYEYGRFVKEVQNRRRPEKKIAVVLYDRNLDNPHLIYEERVLARTDVTFLGGYQEKLFVNFFHDEEFTKGGYLLPQENGSWKFKRMVAGLRLEHIALHGDKIIAGSPFSDLGERSRELRLYRNDEWTELGSVRGVNTVEFAELDADPEPEIVVADGLANIRQKRRRPQIGVLDYDARKGSYQRVLSKKMSGLQGSLRKIVPFVVDSVPYVLGVGDEYIELYYPQKDWRRRIVYRRNINAVRDDIDVLYLGTEEGQATLAVLEDSVVRLMRISLAKEDDNKVRRKKAARRFPK